MRQIPDASAESLGGFLMDAIQPGTVIHTDGWRGYSRTTDPGFVHEVKLHKYLEPASELLPRVHRVISLLRRWLMGSHQGAVSHKRLDYYLEEFTFRFNRRRSKSRAKLFFRLIQETVAMDPVRYDLMFPRYEKNQPPTYWGYLSQADTHLMHFRRNTEYRNASRQSPVRFRRCIQRGLWVALPRQAFERKRSTNAPLTRTALAGVLRV